MPIKNLKIARRQKIKRRIRKKITGTLARPRLSVYKSNTQLAIQIIDDHKGHTLLGLSSRTQLGKGINISKAQQFGKILALQAKAKKITKITFDRNGYLYHGKIKAFAESARAHGLQF